MPADARRVRDLFLTATELPVVERAAYLTAHCGDDAELQAAVERLLAAHEQPASVLVRPAPGIPTAAEYVPITEKPGTKVGPYKLLQQIGEGGMGVVYMAEQLEPVRRKVALKIIKPGMDSAQVVARFEAERQALAMMDHQNIARVLDAGATESGRPYFVMELVHGVPITQFCDDNQLTPRERLALFVPVCQALQHAHQKGIIHRDVKPSNVLVTMYDDKPVPKVIDFGVAKAIEQRLTEKSLFTQFGALVGTFEYMSPEQAEMNAFGVDTRSDVYSLGVLLYELLTGTTPLERTRLRTAALDELVRLIKEEDAPRPSVRLSNSHTLPKIAAARRTEPAQLSKLVRGEIDWIVMKCLEKDRPRRYDTASGLARDVERYLADEPVEACPPSARYRLAKFARKYKKALASAAAFVALLVAGVVVSTLLAVWATSAEREANRQRAVAEAAEQEALQARGEAVRQRDEALATAYANGIGLAQRALNEENIVRARDLLDKVPQEVAGRNMRRFEWDYLHRLCHSELRTLPHAKPVRCVAFSRDGRRVASGSEDGVVHVWDSATGKELLPLTGHTSRVWCVAFSPDGQRLASGSEDGTVKFWNSATGKELLSLAHPPKVSCVAFSPDGRRLAAGGWNNTLKLWDTTIGKELLSLGKKLPTREGQSFGFASVAFSPDGRQLASGDLDNTVKLWDSTTGKELFSLEGHTWTILSVAFTPDGQRLASGSKDDTVKLWDSATGKKLLSFEGHSRGIYCVAFTPDGQRIASAGENGTVKLWDSATGKRLASLQGHTRAVTSVAFSPDGQFLASGSEDATGKIWDDATDKEPFSLPGHEWVHSVAFSPDGRRLASGGWGRTVKIWDSATGKELLSLGEIPIGPDGKHSVSIRSGGCSVAFSPDGRRVTSASGNEYKTVKIWDTITGKELLSLEGHADSVPAVAFSPDGRRLATGSNDGTVKVWDSATGKGLLSFGEYDSGVTSVAFSPDGRHLASGSADEPVKIWDSATGKELLSLEGHTAGVSSVAFSPDGRHLATGSNDGTVKVWDRETGKERFTLKDHAGSVHCVAFSPDSQRLASGSVDSTVKVWDSATGKELLSLKGSAGAVFGVAFSPDGQRLASANEDGSLSVWETKIPPDVRDRRAARQLVDDLFRQQGRRADVLEWLRTIPGMNPTRQQEALAIAEAHPEDPETLHRLAWDLLKLPGREAAGYRQALRFSEAACQLEPKDAVYLTTLAMAHYRLGNDEKALEGLQRADRIVQTQPDEATLPATLAFLAMTRHHLGHAQEAQAVLQRLREYLKNPRRAQDAEAQSFLREAEAVLAKPTTAGGK